MKKIILTLTIIMVLMSLVSCGAKSIDKCTNEEFFETYVPVLSGHDQRVTDGMDGDAYYFYLENCTKEDFEAYKQLMKNIDVYTITNVEFDDDTICRYEIRTETINNVNNGTGYYVLMCDYDERYDGELFITADWFED